MTVDEAINIIEWYDHNTRVAFSYEKKELDREYKEAVKYLKKLESEVKE